MNAMIVALKVVVNCEALDKIKSFQGKCFKHAFSNAYQHATADERVYKGFKYVSIKSVQIDLQKCITWPKKSIKGRQEWMKAFVNVDLC
jgi:hypothetical protein